MAYNLIDFRLNNFFKSIQNTHILVVFDLNVKFLLNKTKKFYFKDHWIYTYTVRALSDGQTVETRKQIDKREYSVIGKLLRLKFCLI